MRSKTRKTTFSFIYKFILYASQHLYIVAPHSQPDLIVKLLVLSFKWCGQNVPLQTCRARWDLVVEPDLLTSWQPAHQRLLQRGLN